MVDLLVEADGACLWNAHDQLLHRPVSVHVLPVDDVRADAVIGAARRSATLTDQRTLRVLDCNRTDTHAYVVNEWGKGTSLDVALEVNGPLSPARAAWLVAETADTVASTHAAGTVHGRLVPENVLIDENGSIRIIGSGVEAALMGHLSVPADDVTHLVALLHAALTGRWPGRLTSQVPQAPREGGRFLRPRQVRAGIPRPLDQICDQGLNGFSSTSTGSIPIPALNAVLGGREAHDLTTAAGLRDALEEFLGEYEPDLAAHATHSAPIRPAGLSPAPWHLAPAEDETAERSGFVLPPPVIQPLPTDRRHTPAAAVEPAAVTEPAPEGAVEVVPQEAPATPVHQTVPAGPSSITAPTEAGLPVFHDEDDDVEWVRTHNPERPAPETPADAAPRPLFAPESADLARRQHHERQREEFGTGDSTPPRLPEDFWSSDSTGPGSTTSGAIPPIDAAPTPVPGRTWLRLAWGVGIAAFVLLVVVLVLHPQGDGDKDPAPSAAPVPTSTPSPSVTGPLGDLVVTDLDPADSAGVEYPADTPKSVDGDVATFWGTSTYLQQFGPGGLKDGVGLVVDLGESRSVRSFEVDVLGGSHTLQLFLTDGKPADVAGLDSVAEAAGEGTLDLTPPESASGRYAVVWLTQLPVQDGGYRGKIAEIRVTA
ncbi:protein kinase domain-containing protein [Nocardioides yefusunii]|uniref:Protein kinase domain-containing protein n=1 Tax=Nocardioides yefusunii TaxID=2500546 RepID=A0ABW1R2L7_9ACTN|nr:protein kinase family protein [Nocardioides yefusunii]